MTQFVENKTLLLVTHRITMLDVVDRIIVIEHGRIAADGSRDIIIDALKQKHEQGGAQA